MKELTISMSMGFSVSLLSSSDQPSLTGQALLLNPAMLSLFSSWQSSTHQWLTRTHTNSTCPSSQSTWGLSLKPFAHWPSSSHIFSHTCFREVEVQDSSKTCVSFKQMKRYRDRCLRRCLLRLESKIYNWSKVIKKMSHQTNSRWCWTRTKSQTRDSEHSIASSKTTQSSAASTYLTSNWRYSKEITTTKVWVFSHQSSTRLCSNTHNQVQIVTMIWRNYWSMRASTGCHRHSIQWGMKKNSS